MSTDCNAPAYWDARFAEGGDWERNGHREQTRAFMEAIMAHLPPQWLTVGEIHPTALDVGCALGDGVEVLRAHGYDAEGCDRSAVAIARAKVLYPGRDFNCAALPPTPADYVFCSNVLEHTADWRALMRDVAERAEVAVFLVPWQERPHKLIPDHVVSFGYGDLPPGFTGTDGRSFARRHCEVFAVPEAWNGLQCLQVYEVAS